MKICVLDGYTLNPGDLSWEKLEAIGDLTIYDRTPENLILERAQDAEVILTNKTPLSRESLDQLTNVKYIGVLATGYDVVDLERARELNITVTNIPTYGTHSVAQMVIALLLELTNRVQRHSDAVKDGAWTNNEDWCFWNYPLIELYNKKIGIVGYGRIGEQVAKIASALGMQVLAYSRTEKETAVDNLSWVSLEELMERSDVISLHCPLTEDTAEMINRENIKTMKKSALLINTARGKLIHNEDLAEALNKGEIAGAALDVLDAEPPESSNPLLKAQNCIITPHISWASFEARSRLLDIAIKNVEAFLQGQPENVVNP